MADRSRPFGVYGHVLLFSTVPMALNRINIQNRNSTISFIQRLNHYTLIPLIYLNKMTTKS